MAPTNNGGGNQMKQNTGRPPKTPTGTTSTLTLKIPTKNKQQIIDNAQNYGMTITEYLLMLVERDS
jgi:hypothetical protein